MGHEPVVRPPFFLRLHRPLAVWGFSACNFFLGVYFSWAGLDVIIHPKVNWLKATRIAAPFFFCSGLAIMVASVGALMGQRMARIIMVALVGVIAGLMVVEYINNIIVAIPYVSESGGWLPTSASAWWQMSSGGRWVIWGGLNYWYFFCKRAGY